MKIFKKSYSNMKSSTLSFKNIINMHKFDNSRNKILNLNLKSCDYVLQNFWSDFAHFTYADKKFDNRDDKFFTQFDNDITNYTKEDNIVFQNEKDFLNYSCDNKNHLIEIQNFENEINILDSKVNNIDSELQDISENNNENSKILISRIPQEFNLNLKTEGHIRILNPGDTKLIADKFIKIEYVNCTGKLLNFDAKRLRTEFFELMGSNVKLLVNIKSYLEANKMYWSLLKSSFIRIKKLGVVNEGIFDLNYSDIEIRSIYGPKLKGNILFNISNCKLQIGSVQGNLKLFSKENNEIVIENMECKSFELNSDNESQTNIEIFVNHVLSSIKIKGDNIKILLILNKENKDQFNISHNGINIFNHDNTKENNIEIFSKFNPDIQELTSWEYMKLKIERKINNKNK